MEQTPESTRDRIVREAMRLFAEHGYAGTPVAKIEAAAGLSAGSGGLYRHFPSKRELLAEGVTRLLAGGGEPVDAPDARTDLRAELLAIAAAGLRRLEHERDFNRVLLRDLARFPDLLARARDEEMARQHERLARWLADRAAPDAPERDWSAVAAVLIGATAHYWLLRDIFGGEHPTGVGEDGYLAAMADLVEPMLRGTAG